MLVWLIIWFLLGFGYAVVLILLVYLLIVLVYCFAAVVVYFVACNWQFDVCACF